MTAKEPHIETEKTTEYLEYRFSEDELKDIGLEMARATNRASEAEEQKKAAMAGFKDTIEKEQLTARMSARHISNGYEMRNIECKKYLDFTNCTVKVIRTDTGEIVVERKMRDNEKQMSIASYDETPE